VEEQGIADHQIPLNPPLRKGDIISPL